MKESTGQLILIILGLIILVGFVTILIGDGGVFPSIFPKIDGLFNSRIPKL